MKQASRGYARGIPGRLKDVFVRRRRFAFRFDLYAPQSRTQLPALLPHTSVLDLVSHEWVTNPRARQRGPCCG